MKIAIRKMLRSLRASWFNYRPLIEVRINADRILGNYQKFVAQYPEVGIAPVLKSNAYGHGLVLTAKILDGHCPFVVVDSYHEALILRNEGIRSNILVIGYTRPETILGSRLSNVAYTVLSLMEARELAQRIQKPTALHLKVDTGMHRQGVAREEFSDAVNVLRSNSKIKLEGLCSHLADPDGDNPAATEQQIKIWNDLIRGVKGSYPDLKYYHLAQTAGSYFSQDIDANIMRLGLGLYGIETQPRRGLEMDLKPALEVKTIVASFRSVKAGESVGYNFTEILSRDAILATIPMGYADGLDRRLSGRGSVKVKNVFCKIVGRVSMNITTIDVSQVPDVKIGEEVQVISPEPKDPNSVSEIAKLCGTIPYEILVGLPEGLRRMLV